MSFTPSFLQKPRPEKLEKDSAMIRKANGFSLVELLIVVAIIGIVASIAIPNLLASRRAANEASAQSSLRTIHSCELTYQATTGRGDYGNLAAIRGDFLTDMVLGSGSKSGYNFAATPTAPGVRPALFYATAVPTIMSGVGQTGTRRFGISEDGVMHGDRAALTPYANEAAVKAAPAVGN
jgi:type IV pilus assembly protein PilA